MIKRRVDLPLLPGQNPADGQPCLDAQVLVFLLDDQPLSGRLYSLNTDDEMLILMEDHGQVKSVPFSRIRYVQLGFDRSVISAALHSILHAVQQPYQLVFIDQTSLTGSANHFMSDQMGIHIVTMLGDSVRRVFVPHNALASYRLDPVSVETPLIAPANEGPTRGAATFTQTDALINSEQLRQMLDHQSSYLCNSYARNKLLGQILISEGLIDEPTLSKVLGQQRDQPGVKLGVLMKQLGVLSTEQIHLVLARKLGVPFVELKRFDLDLSVLNTVPTDLVRQYLVIPLAIYKGRLVVAMEDPTDNEAVGAIRFITGKLLEPVIATQEDIEAAIERYYGSEDAGIDEEVAKESHDQEQKRHLLELREAERLAHEKPIVRLVQAMIIDAVRKHASDIHIRPLENEVYLLFRIDGTLIQMRSLSKSLLPAIVSRIKILGRMDVAEHRLPQDGRAHVSDRDDQVDLRISVVPTVNGESVVIRLLNSKVGLRRVSELGFTPRDQELFIDLLHKSFGMLLVTGPTGSGKSTTLYAALQEVIDQNVNIITVEDPVEYHIDNIEQIQVNSAPGYTFAEALRHILRHDPDVIMIGEIRDRETAKIAVESALTGHLVLSTLHTNSAAAAVTRLLEMGLESYLLSSTLQGVLAQRLVRKNCPHCSAEEPVDSAVRRFLNVADDEVFYRGTGCDACHHTGFSGRMAVYELLMISPAIRVLIEKGNATEVLMEAALREGMTSLTANALARARTRETSLSEVYRVRLE